MPMDLRAPSLDELRHRKGLKWRIYGDDVLPLWVADMDLPVADAVRRVLEEHARTGDLGYAFFPHWHELRDAFVERAARLWGWSVERSQVQIVVNVLQGLDCAVATTTETGQGVVIQTPIYPPFLGIVEANGRRIVANPLRRGAQRWEMDLDHLRRHLDPATRLLLLCSPHNPTGRAFERAELEALGEIVLEHDLTVVADEIWAEVVYPDHHHTPFASLSPELARRTVTLTSATKAFNLAGLPCAVAVFGSSELLARFRSLSSFRLGHPGIVDAAATLAVWRDGGAWLEAALAHLDGNRRLVREIIGSRLPAMDHLSPEATYMAWLDCRQLELPQEPFSFFLDRARVALSNGREFGAAGEGFVRLNFATSRAILEEALERMATAITSA